MSIGVSVIKGPIGELFDQCSGANGQARFEEVAMAKGVTSGLLKFVQNVAVGGGGTQEFIVKDHFTKNNRKVKFWYLVDNFTKHFLNNKVERGITAGQVAVYALLDVSFDPEIMTALGSQRRIIKLAHFYQLIEAQGQGQDGPLLVNGHVNIAYIEDDDGIVWAVSAYWFAGAGWIVAAYLVENRTCWLAGYQVLSQAT